MLTMFILGALILLTTVAVSFAVNPDFGYVIVRCTVTISVDVEEPDNIAYFGTGDEPDRYVISAGPGFDYVSTSSITVKNDSNGAVCQWKLKVSAIHYSVSYPFDWITDTRWSLGDSPDVEQAVLYAVFATSRPATGEFANDDILSTTDAYWTHPTKFDPSTGVPFRYDQHPKFTDYGNKATIPGDRRALWFRFIPPTAVIDEYYRRFTIQVTAELLSQ